MITLIDFYADWCGPCLMVKPIIEKVVKEMDGKVSLEKVNVDEDPQKAAQFGVLSIPTMVILKDGQEIDRKIGALDELSLKNWLSGKS